MPKAHWAVPLTGWLNFVLFHLHAVLTNRWATLVGGSRHIGVLPIAKVLQILGATIFLLCCGAKLR
jgi:hypothetical protein